MGMVVQGYRKWLFLAGFAHRLLLLEVVRQLSINFSLCKIVALTNLCDHDCMIYDCTASKYIDFYNEASLPYLLWRSVHDQRIRLE